MPDESVRSGAGSVAAARPGMNVRRATMKDLHVVAALRTALIEEERLNPLFANPHPDLARRALRLTRTELDATDQVVFLAFRGSVPIGVLRCRAVRRTPLVADTRQAVVTTVYVIPSERRRGVLRSLLDAADHWCRRHRLRGMRLQCGVANAIGRKAWEALGFVPADVVYVRPLPAT